MPEVVSNSGKRSKEGCAAADVVAGAVVVSGADAAVDDVTGAGVEASVATAAVDDVTGAGVEAAGVEAPVGVGGVAAVPPSSISGTGTGAGFRVSPEEVPTPEVDLLGNESFAPEGADDGPVPPISRLSRLFGGDVFLLGLAAYV